MSVCPDDGYSFTVEVDATMHPSLMAAAAALPVAKKPAISGATLGGAGPKRPATTNPNAPIDTNATAFLSNNAGAVASAAAAAAAQDSVDALDATAMVVGAGPIHVDEPIARPALAEPAHEADSTDVPSGTIVGEYRIEKKIGEGGMGAVYSAVHPMIGKKAAIKVISAALGTDASAVSRFVDEARAVNQIGHPNIVDVFAFGALPDGRNYFVMEHLKGESLGDRVGSTTMSLGAAMEILDQVADALEAAHEKNIVHRDLKPDNVYLAAVRGGRTMVKLLDFGIAKLATADGGIAKTRTGMMMGTPGYISPEQARGRNVDHRTDIYALGCMMFEIVCGRLPFISDSAMDIVLMHMTQPPPRPSELWPEIPPQLEHLIVGMLDKNPDNRPSLAQIRSLFSELVTSGLVTIDNHNNSAFRSGLGSQTPGTGPGAKIATGTVPFGTAPRTTPPGSIASPMGTIAGQVGPAEPPRKKTGLLVGVIAGVVLLAGGGIFMATRTGDKPTPVVAAKQPDPPLVIPPPPDTAKTVERPLPPDAAIVEPPKVVTGGSVTLTLPTLSDKAKVELDGNEVASTAKGAEITIEADGDHTLVVTAAGRTPWVHKFAVKAGEKLAVAAKLERVKRVVPVVGVGSGSAKKPVGTVKKPCEQIDMDGNCI